MGVVLAYSNSSEYMSTRTKETISKDEGADMVAESTEAGIECEDEDGNLENNER